MRKNPLASAIRDIASPETNLVSAELYITMTPERRLPSGLRRRYPDLLIALGVDPAAYHHSNGYIIGEQGKPPDFVLEVASASTALNLFIRWEHGRLAWHDPATGQHIATFESEREARNAEREARLAAEARVRELEERLGQQNA